MSNFKKVSALKTPEAFQEHIDNLGIKLNFCPEARQGENSPLGRKINYKERTIGNRWCILPMEGWDCMSDGTPSNLTARRWMRFAESGAKLLYGCEAAAIMESGRSNPRQLMINENTVVAIATLRNKMVKRHAELYGTAGDLYIGLQITHSGRFSHPHRDEILESRIAYSHPLLDKKFGNDASNVISDMEVENIIQHYVKAAKLAQQAGFDFVDIKHAHGYLGHEFLSAHDRPGKYGGSFENRTRFFREIAEGISKEAPGLDISLRLSLFDWLPFEKNEDGSGKPMEWSGKYPYAFGGDGTGSGIDMTETIEFLKMIQQYGVKMVCTTVGSPYYNPHIQRPAYYPVVDGYESPEDPLTGAARQINAVAEVKKQLPGMLFVGSGYTCLQEWLPNVGEYVVENNMADFIGIGRMVLSYPEICTDHLQGK